MLEVEMQFIEAHETVRIDIDIKLEIVDRFRREPTGTQFRSGKTRSVEDDDIDSGLAKLPGAGRSCRPASDN